MQHLLRHRCTIQRNTQRKQDGQYRSQWSSVATAVKCLLQEMAGNIQSGEAGKYLRYDAILFCDQSVDVRSDGTTENRDRIVMTSPVQLAGKIFLVKHVADESGQQHHRSVFLVREGA